MEKIGVFKSKKWGHVDAWRATYDGKNGPLAVTLTLEDGEPLATLSVNMYRPECSRDSKDLPGDCFYVKTWGGHESFLRDALDSGLFVARSDLPMAQSGYVEAPVWQLAKPA